MLKLFIHRKYFIAIISFSCFLMMGCSKSSDQGQAAQQYFEDNYLDRNYTIHLSTDNGTDLTAQYSGYSFRINKGNPLDGLMTATKNGVTSNGTWSTNSDYSNLSFSLPGGIPAFTFLVREWKMTRKGIPILEMAAANNDPKVLHFERQ